MADKLPIDIEFTGLEEQVRKMQELFSRIGAEPLRGIEQLRGSTTSQQGSYYQSQIKEQLQARQEEFREAERIKNSTRYTDYVSAKAKAGENVFEQERVKSQFRGESSAESSLKDRDELTSAMKDVAKVTREQVYEERKRSDDYKKMSAEELLAKREEFAQRKQELYIKGESTAVADKNISLIDQEADRRRRDRGYGGAFTGALGSGVNMLGHTVGDTTGQIVGVGERVASSASSGWWGALAAAGVGAVALEGLALKKGKESEAVTDQLAGRLGKRLGNNEFGLDYNLYGIDQTQFRERALGLARETGSNADLEKRTEAMIRIGRAYDVNDSVLMRHSNMAQYSGSSSESGIFTLLNALGEKFDTAMLAKVIEKHALINERQLEKLGKVDQSATAQTIASVYQMGSMFQQPAKIDKFIDVMDKSFSQPQDMLEAYYRNQDVFNTYGSDFLKTGGLRQLEMYKEGASNDPRLIKQSLEAEVRRSQALGLGEVGTADSIFYNLVNRGFNKGEANQLTDVLRGNGFNIAEISNEKIQTLIDSSKQRAEENSGEFSKIESLISNELIVVGKNQVDKLEDIRILLQAMYTKEPVEKQNIIKPVENSINSKRGQSQSTGTKQVGIQIVGSQMMN